MKKVRTWLSIIIPIVLIVALVIGCAHLWQKKIIEENDLKIMCKSSINAALEHFENYSTTGNETDYIAGVAEFRAYMTSYLCLVDEPSEAEYLWCNTLYGYMTMKPEKVKANVLDLVDALEYLAEDYDHPNGFNLVNALNNKIVAE